MLFEKGIPSVAVAGLLREVGAISY